MENLCLCMRTQVNACTCVFTCTIVSTRDVHHKLIFLLILRLIYQLEKSYRQRNNLFKRRIFRNDWIALHTCRVANKYRICQRKKHNMCFCISISLPTSFTECKQKRECWREGLHISTDPIDRSNRL